MKEEDGLWMVPLLALCLVGVLMYVGSSSLIGKKEAVGLPPTTTTRATTGCILGTRSHKGDKVLPSGAATQVLNSNPHEPGVWTHYVTWY